MRRRDTDTRAIVPIEEYTNQFGWSTTREGFLLQLLIGEFGLKLIERADAFSPDLDCGGWVLGPGQGHYFDFSGKGTWSEKITYGALAQYGTYRMHDRVCRGGKFISRAEAQELQKAGKTNYSYQETHIGITTPKGRVISKWGQGHDMGHLIEHPAHIVPYAYGEVEFVSFSVPVQDAKLKERHIFVMPHSLHNCKGRCVELILTDGKRKVGSMRGQFEGELGSDRSSFVITNARNLCPQEMPHLLEAILPAIQDNSPAIAGTLWVDFPSISGETLDYNFRAKWQL